MSLFALPSVSILHGSVTKAVLPCYTNMKLHIIIAILVFSPMYTHAQQLRFEPMILDLGEMRQNEVRTMRYTIHNTGSDTVYLGEPRASCGCTAILLDASTLPPGDSASITGEFSSGPYMLGEINKSVQVIQMLNDQERNIATLRVRAEVVGDLSYEPSTVQFRVVIGDTVKTRIILRSNSEKTVEISDISTSLLAYVDDSPGNTYDASQVRTMPFTDVLLEPESRAVPPGGEIFVDVTMFPKDKGQINGMLRVAFPQAEIRIPIVGVVLRYIP